MKRLFFLLLMFFGCWSVYAQPSNDDPCNAIPLTLGTACSYSQYTNADATASSNVPAPGCASYSGGDVWFSLVVPASGNIILNSNTGVITDGGMAIYSGSCNSLTLIACDDDGSPNGLMPMISQSGLTPGLTIYVRFWEYGNNNNGTFSICAYSPLPPSNDDPCNSIPLNVGTACSYSQYTNAYATASANVPAPGCGSYSGGDVWFSFVVPASGGIVINTDVGVIQDGGMAIYSGTCNNLTLIACDDNSSPNGLMPMITRSGLSPGSTIYVRFWEYSNDNNGTFSICAYSFQPITNDDPCNAISLPVSSNCVMAAYSNVGATSSSGVPAPGCGNYQGGDVWFSAVVPANGILSINTQTGLLTDAAMALYSGTCNTLTLIECDDDDGPGLMPGIYRTGLTPGSTVYIRVWDRSNDESGDFSICTKSINCNSASVNSACTNADPFCTGVNYEYCNTTGVSSLGGGGAYGCLGSAPNPSFFYFNAATSGPIDIFIQQNTYTGNPIDVDFILWGPFSSYASMCSGYSANNIIDCSYDPAPQETANIPNAVAGQWYLLLITNYSNQAGIFTFSQTNSGAAGSGSTNCNLITATPGPCSNGLFTVTGTVRFTSAPNSGTLTVTNSCGGSQVFNAPFTSPISYSIPNSCANGGVCSVTGVFSAANATVLLPATYTAPTNCYTFTATPGPCTSGNYVLSGTLVVGCPPPTGTLTITSSCGGSVTYTAPFSSSLNWTLPATPGVGGTCQISAVFSAIGAPVITPISVTQPSCCTPVTPTFTAIGPLCYGSAPPSLPTTSNNGIQGTWNPATINTNVAGTTTYTFNPSAGSCASSTTLSVVVNPPPVVYAHGTNPTCANQCNGSATVDVVGGTPPYTYTWSNGGSTRTITNLCPGTYTVTVKDANNCSSTTNPVSVAGCFQIQSIMVDACSNTEWEQEMVFFQVGTSPLSTTSLTATWPNTNDTWRGLCQNPTFINNTNATITGGGVLIGVPPGGTIPANANVVLITGNTLTVSANSFANLSDTLYVIFQCSGNTQGHFANGDASNPQNVRTLIMSFGAGCKDTVSYFPNQLVTTSGSVGTANGAYVNYSATGTATYLNYGCVIPYNIPTATVTLTAPPPVNPTFNPIASLCQGATAPNLPDTSTNVPSIRGTWSPASINTTNAGTVTYTFTPAAGACANTATLTVTINPKVTPTFPPVGPFCANASIPALSTTSGNGITGTWSPAINNTATTNYTFMPSAGQCALSTSLTIVVNQKYNNNINASTCTGTYTLPWGPVVTVAGAYSNTYQSTKGCDSIVTINLSLSATTLTNLTATVCQGQSYVLPWGTPVNAQNTYSYTYSGTGGCDSIVSVDLTVTPLTVPVFNPVSPVCAGTVLPPLPTTSINGITGTWSPAINNTATTTYVFTPDAGQCAGTVSLTITIYPNPIVSLQGVNPTCSFICNGSATANVTGGNGPYVYDWNTGANTQSISGLCAGVYSASVSDVNGCVSSGQSSLTLTAPLPVTPTFNPIAAICRGSVPPSLPDFSNNVPPIGGTWSPSLINTSNTGVSTYTFTPAAGTCALTSTLDITIAPPPAKTLSVSACANKLPYTWQGHVFTAPGSVSDTIPGLNGCDTQRTILFSVNPLLTSTRNISVCANKFPYTWQGHVFTGPGLVTDTVPGVSGCDTQRTIIVSVIALLTTTRNISVCENRLPYTWQGHVFASPATIYDTVSGPSGCDTIRTINFTVDLLNTATRYLSACANKLPYIWQGHVFSGAATIEDTVAGPSGCDTVRTIVFSVNPLFSSIVNLSVCSYRLPYTWQGYVFTSDSTIVDTVRRNTGCDTVRTIKLIVNPTPTATYGRTICANKLPYSWLGHVFTGAGTIKDTVPGVAGGCDTIRTITLSVNSLFVTAVSLSVCANKLPYSWLGHVFTGASTIRDTVPGIPGGCDTARTITLSVSALFTVSVSLSVCANKIPYTWQGHVFTGAGTIRDTVPGIPGGCDTIRNLTLVINPLLSDTVRLQICANNLPYAWQGHVYSASGTYKDTVSGITGGCDTQRTIILSLAPILTATINLAVCPHQLPYSWQGHVFAGPGTIKDTVPGQGGCDTQRTIILSLLPLQIDTIRLTTCPNSLPYSYQGHVFSAAGTIYDTVPGSTGCYVRRTIILTVTSVINTQVSMRLCPSQLPFLWNGQSISGAGVYYDTLLSAQQCDSNVTMNLTISSVTASPDQVICKGGSASLLAIGGVTYSWSPATGLSDSNISNPIASPLVTTDFIVTSQIATNNLITNSDFSQGNSGFSSGYSYNSNNGWAEGTYFVGSNVAAWHPGFAPCTDHTTGSGNIMMVNGATTPNVPVYCTTVPVQPNTNYAFSTWLTTFSNPPALLQFSINGNLLGTPFSGSSALCSWNNFYAVWNSGNATSATICIVNQNTVGGGNDFGLDDISFSALCTDKDTVRVTVNPVYDTTLIRSACAGVPFVLPWGGTANTAGIYSHSYQTVKGCDSTVHIDLSIRNISSSVTPATVCDYDLPYNWNGNSYAGAATDTIILTNSVGCDSLAILRLTVKTRTSHTSATSVCVNDLPYTWNGLTFTGPARDTVVFTNAAGCDSLDILDLSVRPVSFYTKQVSVCQNDLPYSWNGMSYNGPVTDTVMLINAAGCDSFDILKLSLLSVTSMTKNVSVCQNDLPYIWNGRSYTGPAVDTVMLTNRAGCDSLDIINLLVKTISVHADTVRVCPTALPYVWNGQSYSGASVDTVILTNAAGCDSIVILHLSIKSPSAYTEAISACESYMWHGNTYYASTNAPIFITTNAMGCDSVITLDLTIHTGTHNVFNNSACQTYSWHGVTYTTSGQYYFNYQNAFGCQSADTLNLTISSGIPAAYKDTACNSYSWNGTVYSQSGNYLYSFSSGSCNVTDTLHLIIHTGTYSGLAMNACDGFQWHGAYYNGSGTYLYNYLNSFGCPSVDTLNLTVNSGTFTNQYPSACDSFIWRGTTYTSSGDFGYSYLNGSNCFSADSLHLTIHTGTYTAQSLSECLTYTWHGTQYTSTGIYVYPYTNGFGCSSADTLHLTINDGTPSVINTAACDSFRWNGSTYTQTGDYQFAYSSGACNVTDTLHLTVHSGTFSSADSNVCRSLTWYGSVYTSSGIYYHNYSNAFGCSSADTLRLSVSSGLPVVVMDTACGSYLWNGTNYTSSGQYLYSYTGGACQVTDTLKLTIHSGTFTSQSAISCGSYSWYGNIYSVSGTYVHDYLNVFGCSSADTLHLTVNDGTFSSENVSACNSYYWNGSTYFSSGTYSYAYTNAAGCPSMDTLKLIISTGAPIVSAASACNSYLWNGTDYTQSGTYIYQYPPGSGCLIADTLVLTVKSGTFASESQAACGSYFWNGQNFTQSGNYLRTYINSQGCPSADTLVLRIDPIPPAPSVSSPVIYCQQSEALPLTAAAQGSLVWYSAPSGGPGSGISPVPSTTSVGNSYYYVSQMLGLCEGPRVPLIVKVVPKPVLGIDRDIHLCYGRSINLSALYNTDDLSAIWLFNQQTLSDPTSVNTPGLYQLLALNAAGCKDTATVRLSLQPQLTANAGPDDTADFYTPYQLQGSGGGSYLWTPGPPLINNSFISNPIALLTETTQFILEVQDPIGCKDYDTVIIYVRLGTDFYVPNAFTPNGDGLNDYFSPVPLGGIARLDYFAVYNRFGNLVFQTSDITRRWDGTYAGRPQDPDNFVWVLKGRNRLGQEKFLKGNVILIR